MEHIAESYKTKIEELMMEFKELNLDNPAEVLLWFYLADNTGVLFDNNVLGDFLYDRLRAHNYSMNISIEDESKTLYLLSSAHNSDKAEVGRNIISLILSKLSSHEPFGLVLSAFIEKYNSNYNSAIIMENMMSRLKRAVGSVVVFNIIRNGKFEVITGNLEEVKPNKAIVVDGEMYPFIDVNNAITKINNVHGDTLYSNPKIDSNVNLEDSVNVISLAVSTFGTSTDDYLTRLY